MKYRREIDGLRAVAVVPVILFHAGFEVFSGGFVGVDVFFVISGYLITIILLTEIEKGEFSIAKFYERRARRILPALFVVMAACLPFAWLWMVPDQLKAFGQSVTAVVFFVSNILFWQESGGYFAPAAELKPLLHTWSLAVEEQYYLLAPVSLALLWRFGRRAVFWCVVATALASLLATEWGWRFAPRANFYLPQFRIWELLAGSICGFIATSRAPRPNELLAAIGLALIVFAIFAFDSGTPFPSFYALVPVVGASLIVLYAHKGTFTARLLSTPVLVGIGLISYSAYLWHQPLFAFARIRSMADPSPELMSGLAVLSLALAYLSWRYVEQPFRRGPIPLLPSRQAVFRASTVAGVLFAAIGTYANVSKGIPSRLAAIEPGSREERLMASARMPMGTGRCEPGPRTNGAGALCAVFEPANAERRILIVGDSHSSVMLPAWAGVGERNAVYWLGAPGCPPLIGVSVHGGMFDLGVCEDVARRQIEMVKERGFDTVVLVARWSLYPDGYNPGLGRRVSLSREGEMRGTSQADSAELFAQALPNTVAAYLALGVNVVLVEQIPEQKVLPEKTLQQAALLGMSGGVDDEAFEKAIWESSTTVEEGRKRLAFTRDVVEKLRGEKVWVVSFEDAFERNGRYVWGDRGGAFYSDQNHLSVHGTEFLRDSVTRAFEQISRQARGDMSAVADHP
ncbi:acyltransferase [Starkeya koreensis]|uniref:Acyltransferase n=1 Tax=Ancylobacter koreensis TaxID=266121 RepID=A0ABT0DGS1_9HYPH|nr:acyltransferase family protein [Ancylobacter koreensis]MCK0206474.1 acyltransferase [Ancylobacter koreensis]